MSIIMGINYGGHDTSAVLMVDGRIVAACEEERFNLEKHTREFPVRAAKECLSIANKTIEEVDHVAFGYKPDLLLKDIGPIRKMRRDLPTESEFVQTLKEKLNYNGRVHFHPHHLCHLASAYYPSGFMESLLMSNDGVGETTCSMLARGIGGKIKVFHSGSPWPNSLGLFYSAITYYLGWKPMYDEGITMGLAPLGDSSKIVPGTSQSYLEIFRKMIYPVERYDVEVSPEWFAFHKERDKFVSDKFVSLFGSKRNWEDNITENHKNIAAAAQDRLEEIVLNHLRLAQQETGLERLCIAGGVGLNCSLNGKIMKSGIFKEIFVQPAAGDNGTAIGACYLTQRLLSKNLKPVKHHDFYLGTRHTNEYIRRYLRYLGLKFQTLNGDYSPIVKELKNRKIIGWFQGPAEFGPRALGNRSILVSPYPADIKDHINKRVKFREPFRPFAPAVLSSCASEYFHINQESPHMLMAVQVKKNKKDQIPAVIHEDDSARVQTVTDETNSKFNKLLEQFYAETGCPVILNTSFNVKGQPIVNSCSDAIQCFFNTNIDVLVLGDFLIKKEDNDGIVDWVF